MGSTFTEASPELVQAIVDHSLTNIYAARALRNEVTGQVIDFQIYFANPTFVQRVRRSESDLQQQTLRTLFPVLEQTGFLDRYAAVVETGVPFEGEQEYPGPNGHFWYQTTVKKLGDGIVVNFIDITDTKLSRQQAEAALRLTQGVMDASQSLMTYCEAVYDDTGAIVDFTYRLANQGVAKLIGAPTAEIVGGRMTQFFPSVKEIGLFAQYVEVVQTNQIKTFEFPYQTDGYNGWYLIQASPLGQGFVLSFVDITGRKQTELKLQQTNSLLQAVLDGAQAGIISYRSIRDAEGRIVDFEFTSANPVATQLTGRSVDELIGQRLLTVFPTNRQLGIFDRYVAVVETGQPQQFETHYQGDGLDTWFDVTAVRQGHETADGFVLTFLDISDRKRAEAELQRQTTLLQTTLDASISSILAMTAIRNEEGQIVDFMMDKANQSVERSLGKTPAELEGRTLLSVYPGNVDSGFFAVYAKAADTGQPQQATYHYTDVNGYEGWFEASAVRHAPDKIVLTFMNVTDYKQTEQRLSEQATTFNTVLASLQHGLFIARIVRNPSDDLQPGGLADLIYEYVSDSMLRDRGLSREAIIGNTALTLFPSSKQSRFWQAYEDILRTGEPQQFDEHYPYDGFDIYVTAQVSFVDAERLVVTYQNTTDLKRAQQQVQQQADLVNSVLNATLTAVATYEPVRDETGTIIDFRYTLANQASLDMLGLTPEVLYTKTLCGLTASADRPLLGGRDAFDRYVTVVQTGESVTMERQILGRWYLVSAVRFNTDGLLTSSIDITEIKQAREQLAQINTQLQRSNESLDQFASVASHDLQEPLRKIISFGDLLADQYGSELGDGVVLLQRMQSAATRMQILIRDLLAYARLSKGAGPAPGQAAHQLINLNELVGDVLGDLEVAVTEKGAVVEVGELPTLAGDALQLRQVFQNLLSNALKFTQPGRTPRITFRCETMSGQEVPAGLIGPAGNPKAYYAITVADNGIGFSDKYRERIFGAFERLHGKNSTYGGSGIGLAIVRRVMDNHNGAVTAQSVEGEGATFTLYLPTS